MDIAVLKVQKWLNKTYGDVPKFGSVPEDGHTGWATIYGLRKGLQYEFGISELDDGFGDLTIAACNENVGVLGIGYSGNIAMLIQGAFWCKGISPNDFSRKYTEDTVDAVKQLQANAGITPDGSMTTNLMRALFDMSAFALVSDGDQVVRDMQQWLNANYEHYIGLRPCDGIYQRDTNQALIYALQVLSGVSTPNGNYGSQTIQKTPTIVEGVTGDIVKLIQYGLYVNNFYKDGAIDGYYSPEVADEVLKFRHFMRLPEYNGIADVRVIKGLLTSNGDTSRDSVAFDCATQLTDVKMISRLYNAGFSIVGRYLTGTVGQDDNEKNKYLTSDEVSKLTSNGFSIFPIYEDGGYREAYFTAKQGNEDAYIAANAARDLGFPDGTIIYFAADFDLQDGDIDGTVMAYMAAVKNALEPLGYITGMYGTRNMCRHAASKVGIDRFFVANMSYGWSGNLGFPMPDGWCFDQFVEYTTGSGVDIDQDAASYLDPGQKHFEETGITAEDALNEIKGSLDIKLGVPYTTAYGPFKVKWLAAQDIAEGDSNSTFTISNYQLPQTKIRNWVSDQFNPSTYDTEQSVETVMNGLKKMNLSAKIKKGKVSVSYGISSDGTYNVSMTYYVYSLKKGNLKETLSITVSLSFENSDIDWPDNLGTELVYATAGAAVGLLAVAALLSFPADALLAGAAGVVSFFVSLVEKLVTIA
ncbi:hypothetical protein [Lactobacillus plantarum] [Lactiplantibacillus mudanjiangensis]|uniref:glycoside hydrolase domain-containing protein n=1 Tax=Lactiplantibacillus mudanjiangensis TaxID=1296538 RepID=UPI001015A2E3|nr:hypothetical protein [Lactobacillus plantarum] [Lactiplantibacillus mudanjiangensis]